MLSLHTNNAALSAQNSIGRTQHSLSTSMTRLSTGYRINSAMDDAAGLQIATRLKAQTSGMAVAMRNTQNSTSMLQTAEGALDEVTNILVRMKDLATQAADASSSKADKRAMQSEYDALGSELSNIIGNTSFGGSALMKVAATGAEQTAASTPIAGLTTASNTADTNYGNSQTTYNSAVTTASGNLSDPAVVAAKAAMDSNLELKTAANNALSLATQYSAAAAAPTTSGSMAASMSFQIGASASETMAIDMSTGLSAMHDALRATSANYNKFGGTVSGTSTELTGAGVSAMIDTLQTAIASVGSVRSTLGATANRLDHVYNNLANISTNTKAATGRIMDVDFATESSNMTAKQMLMQASTAMLKQSNGMSSMVMSLLQ